MEGAFFEWLPKMKLSPIQFKSDHCCNKMAVVEKRVASVIETGKAGENCLKCCSEDVSNIAKTSCSKLRYLLFSFWLGLLTLVVLVSDECLKININIKFNLKLH